MNFKKVLFLSLALLLPISIFIFLKVFGENQFDVPLLYQEGKINKDRCSGVYQTPYVLPDTIVNKFVLREKKLSLISFESISSINKIVNNYADNLKVVDAKKFDLNESELQTLRDCVLLAEPPFDLILVDNEKRIRGYYKSDDRDEIDRLDVEIKIILKQY